MEEGSSPIIGFEGFKKVAEMYKEETGKSLCEQLNELAKIQAKTLAELIEAEKLKEAAEELGRLETYIVYKRYCEEMI